jgi:hypothetical protein
MWTNENRTAIPVAAASQGDDKKGARLLLSLSRVAAAGVESRSFCIDSAAEKRSPPGSGMIGEAAAVAFLVEFLMEVQTFKDKFARSRHQAGTFECP